MTDMQQVVKATGLTLESIQARLESGEGLGKIAWDKLRGVHIEDNVAEQLGDLAGWPVDDCPGCGCINPADTVATVCMDCARGWGA